MRTEIKQIFDSTAAQGPQFAIAAAYSLGDDDPIVLTAGPTKKGGTTRVAQNARWHIGSITKSFTATLVMRLAEQGQLSIDEPVSTYLSKFVDDMDSDWKSVTLRHLLGHTAGLIENASRRSSRSAQKLDPFEGRRSILSELWSEPSRYETGKFVYSNIGYVLAGVVAEEVSGRTWEELVVSELGEPLELTSLGFGAPRESDAPRGHKSIIGFNFPVAPEELSSDNPRWMGPAGALHLSITDLLAWGRAHNRACSGKAPGFLSPESCRAMQTAHSDAYGLGWAVSRNEKFGPIVWHNGSNTMWYAMMTLFPDREAAFAVATNVYNPKRAETLMHQLTEQVVGKLD